MRYKIFNKKIEVWTSSGSWYRPSEWVWSYDNSTSCGCIIVEFGWWGFTIFKNGCIGDD